MAISIPAAVDAVLTALQADLRPNVDATTNTASRPSPPYALGNRVADFLGLLSDLVDSGTLTGVGIHAAADATNVIAAADATDQGTANTLLNELKTDFNAHRVIVGSSEHIGADVTNTVTAADATDLATSITLVNEIKAAYNAHLALNGATGHYGPDVVNTVPVADAADLAGVVALANAIKVAYTAHIANISAGSLTSVVDNGAFTGTDALVGATITFAAATTTADLQGLSRTVVGSSANVLYLNTPLPTSPAIGDTFTLAYTVIDTDLASLRGGKNLGDSQSNPYGNGPALANALLKMIAGLGATPSSYLDAAAAEPFGLFSPHGAGGGQWGHGGGDILAALLEEARDAVAAYTAPA
jgi:hypothetical protein